MITYHLLRHESLRDLQQTKMTRTELRRLVQSLNLDLGSRLLLAGENVLGFIGFFTGLGIDVTCIDEAHQSTANIEQPSEKTAGFPAPPAAFDAVLTDGLSTYRQTLFSQMALRTTGDLAGLLRPGGRFALLHEKISSQDDARHAEACFSRHLRCFTANVQTIGLSNGRQWGFSLSTTPGDAHSLTVMVTPANPLVPGDWRNMADIAADGLPASCCEAYPITTDHAWPEAA